MAPSSPVGSFVLEPGPGLQWQAGQGPCSTYVAICQGLAAAGTLELRHEAPGARFREILTWGEWLAVGLSTSVCLLHPGRNLARMVAVDGYFGSFYALESKLLIASATEVIALSVQGVELWRTPVAVDGVLLHRHDATQVWGDAELDPPGGWRPFVLNHCTGALLE